tara:strand:- start:853 stop:2571 length:1719 start_codon:yes stop_codon:yes gene_type:complete
MNIFNFFSNKIKKSIIENKKVLDIEKIDNSLSIQIESPPIEFNSDLSTNIAMVLGKLNKKNPKILAVSIKKLLESKFKDFKSIEIAGSGFLNINLSDSFLMNFVNLVLKDQDKYGSNKLKKKYNIEFVSANPTGPLHVGHCRGAIYGDVLANLIKFNGGNVVKEYYINDYGSQIFNFTKSVYLRLREIKFNETFVNNQNLYPGEYIKDIASEILKENSDMDVDDFKKSFEKLKKLSLDGSMKLIKRDLKNLGIIHDNFISENDLVKKKLITKVIKKLEKAKYVKLGYLQPPKGEEKKDWKKIKRLIFKSSIFGDDSDRALQKNDGSWTYFANDVAYHSNKVDRKFDILINILGADHIGYIKRITSAVDALSNKKVNLYCKVCQLVKLYKDGKPFKMSKRAGEFITVSDLLKEVNKDSIRFMMLNRNNDVELDFDFNKVIEKTKENPIYYVQYCYARICSIYRSLGKSLDENHSLNKKIELNDYENKLLRKVVNWPKIIESSVNKYEPHRIIYYLYDLATLFHGYWSKGNENKKYRLIIDGKIKNESLIILKLVSIVIKNGMDIIGVSLPQKM